MDEQTKQTRDRLRAATLGAPAVVESKTVLWNSEKYEVRRPTLKQQREIDEAAKDKKGERDNLRALMHALIKCVFVPGSAVQVFERGDVDAMENRGQADFVGAFMTALGELSKEADPDAVEKNSESATTE
jgi:hypothetical protein